MRFGWTPRGTDLHRPHDWFAWRPVCLSCGSIAWLETVRRYISPLGGTTYWSID